MSVTRKICPLCSQMFVRESQAQFCMPCAKGRDLRGGKRTPVPSWRTIEPDAEIRQASYAKLARRYVHEAIRNGDLPFLDGTVKCADCSAAAAVYDHRDYFKPMSVAPVCYSCNSMRGKGKNRDPSKLANQSRKTQRSA